MIGCSARPVLAIHWLIDHILCCDWLQYGLYSSFIGCFIYVVFGTSKDVALGPTAIQSLLTATYGRALVAGDATCAILLGLFTGIVQIGMWLFNLGMTTCLSVYLSVSLSVCLSVCLSVSLSLCLSLSLSLSVLFVCLFV